MICSSLGNCKSLAPIRFVGVIADKAIYQCDKCKAIYIDTNYLKEV